MPYNVIEVSGRKGLDDFLKIPLEIYHDDPNWIPPQTSEVRRILDPSKNPYFKNVILKKFVCYSGDRPVCRSILVINPRHRARWKRNSAFFGFFESFNDSNAVKCLFERIENDCRSYGSEYLEGPLNPNHYSELGILVDNFDCPPVFFEVYNPPYYQDLLKGAGFAELARFHARINPEISATSFNIPGRFSDHENITIRKLNIFRLGRDMEIMREINNDAFGDNWFFLPLTREEYRFSARFMFLVTSPGLILFAEYRGQPVGMVQFVINFNKLINRYKGRIMPWNLPSLLLQRRRIKELVIFSLGVKRAFRHTKVFTSLIRETGKIMRQYSSVSTTWMSNENHAAVRGCELLGMKPYKHFVIFSKKI